MKKKLAVSICLVCLFLLSSCGIAQAKRVDAMIFSIGTVTLESEDKIIAAEEAVDSLAPDAYKQLENLDELEEARNTLEALKVDEQILAIGEVTVESREQIVAAEEAVSALNEDARQKLQYADKLEGMWGLYAVAIENEIEDIEDMIQTDSGNATLNRRVKTVYQAYNSAPDTVKDNVSNFALLEEEKRIVDKIQVEKINEAAKILEGSDFWEIDIINLRSLYEGASPEAVAQLKFNVEDMIQEANEQLELRMENLINQAGNGEGSNHTGKPGSKPTINSTPATVTLGMENALETAYDYLRAMPFSASGLYDQLEYEGYLPEECQYAVDHCNANWNEQAARAARQYLDIMSFSKEGLINQLQYEGYTYNQAVYGVEANGY